MNIPFERVQPMSGQEIADEFGSTRQYISNTLKSAMKKVYKKMKVQNPELTPFEIVNAMREFFGCSSTEDIEMFYNAFPPAIRKEIKESL